MRISKAAAVFAICAFVLCASAFCKSVCNPAAGKVKVQLACKLSYANAKNAGGALTTSNDDYELPYIHDGMDHDWDNGTITTAPTCTQTGVRTYTCRYNSSHTYTETIPAKGHKAGIWYGDASGHWCICVVCDEKFCEESHTDSEWITDIIPTFETGGHRYKECPVCGYITAEESIGKLLLYTPGDINSDSEVNNKDLTRLFQYLSEWDVVVNEPALDVNGDGDVNNKDLTRLFQYLSEWDVVIH